MSDTHTNQSEKTDSVHPTIQRTADFSDRLSPMLVKELRQGLKGYSFMILFIAIQAIITLFILSAIFEDSYDNTGQSISQIVFNLLSIAILIAQPLRGMGAISSEIKENTIELMVMTRLSAWRIAFGKWISIVSQSALIVTAVAPYLILRYFFGGMQLFPEIFMLFSMFLLSACFTAITVGLSAISSVVIRGIFSAVIAIFTFSYAGASFGSRSTLYSLLEFFSFNSTETTLTYFSFLTAAFYFGWLALDYGASYIAPAAENRATPRRIVSLSLIALIIAFTSQSMHSSTALLMTMLAAPVIIISLTEICFMVPTTSAAFLRRGILVRLSRFILYPGWQSGIWFFLLLYAITVLSISFLPAYQTAEAFHTITITFSILIFPLTVTKLLFPKTSKLFSFYVSTLLASLLIFLIAILIINTTDSKGIAILFYWLPPMQYYLYFSTLLDFDSPDNFDLIYICSLALNWGICFLRSIPSWKLIRRNETLANAMLEDITEKNSSASQ